MYCIQPTYDTHIQHSTFNLLKSLRSDDGKSFFINNIETLASNILPQYFKHSNFSSFVRQLNFYGFTKAKDIKVVEANDAKYWQFHHLHFQRENPELLVKIVRRLANSNSCSHATGHSSLQGKKLNGAASAIASASASDDETETGDKGNKNMTKGKKQPGAKERRETDIVKKEIQELKGKLHSMEDEMKKLTNIMSSVNMINDNDHGDNGQGTDDNVPVPEEVHTDLNRTDISMCTENGSVKEGGNESEGSVFLNSAKWQITPSSKRIAGANKKPRILLNDSHLFGSGSSTNNPTDTTTAPSSASNANTNQCSKRSKSLHNVSPKTLIPMAIAIAVREHAASLDLPDLGLASNDADLFLDGTDQSSAPSRILSRSDSTRRGSVTGVVVNVNELLQMHTTGDEMEVDDIISSLDSDAASVRVSVPYTTQDQQSNGSMTDTGELLPGLLSDEEEFDKFRNYESDDETAEEHYLDLDVKEDDLLDQNHLLNLETCLATLPLADRIVFVQDVMKNIRGMDDLLKQGLTVVAKSDSAPSTFTLTTGGARLMVDRYLSELESLLSRAGLSIELGIQQKPSSLKTSSTCSHGASCARRRSVQIKKKDSSFLEIKA